MIREIFTLLMVSSFTWGCMADTSGYQTISQNEITGLYRDLAFVMPILQVPEFAKGEISILEYGAVPDGVTLNTQAIQKAIDEAGKKGGTVIVPAGIWLTGPIVLKSNVRLHTEHNALVIFTDDFMQYPIQDAIFEGVETKRCQSPLSALNAENIAITGYGTFNGSGDAWRMLKKSKVTSNQWKAQLAKGGVLSEDGKTWFPDEGSRYAQTLCVDQNVPVGLQSDAAWDSIRSFLRPVMLNFVRCKNILLEGVTFENSPAWNLHPLMCENLILNRLTVRNPWYSQNGDGVDVESCKNIIITNCNFDVGDDAICMKSGKNEDGRRRAMPTENVIVDGCTVYHGHGGFVVGSEMSGDIRNVSVSNCLFIGTDVGLRFKSTRGRGGIVENIFIKNINMSNIPTDPLLFDLFYGGKGAGEESDDEIAARMKADIPAVTEETPQFRDIFIENVVCNSAKRAMYFNGLPEMKIKNVHLINVMVKSVEGAVINQTDGLNITNLKILNEKGEPLQLHNVENAKLQNVLDANNKIVKL